MVLGETDGGNANQLAGWLPWSCWMTSLETVPQSSKYATSLHKGNYFGLNEATKLDVISS